MVHPELNAIRAAHALIHIGVNHVGLRFAAYLAGCTTLAVIWVRFAADVI